MNKSYGLNNYLAIKIKKRAQKNGGFHKNKGYNGKGYNPNKTIRCHNKSFSNKCVNSYCPATFNMCCYGTKKSMTYFDSNPCKTKVFNVEWIFCEDSNVVDGDEDISHLIEFDNLLEHHELYPINFQYTYR